LFFIALYLEVKEMADAESSNGVHGEPLYRVETGNYVER
jgi:hypothetical protein